MIAILSLLLLGASGSTNPNEMTMRYAKDPPQSQPDPQRTNTFEGPFTAVYPIAQGSYEEIEPLRRRLAQLTAAEFRTKVLDEHNILRQKTAQGLAPCNCGELCGAGHNGAGKHPGATNMNALIWDTALEKVAQQYSDRCLFIHNDGRSSEAFEFRNFAEWTQTEQKYMGENLAISSTGEKVWNNVWNGNDYGIYGSILGWWEECENYELQNHGRCVSNEAVGHYTQMVRADARFVGCGITICPNGVQTETSSYSWANMNLVCNYGGGQYGDRPYEVALTAAEVASNCPADRTPNYQYEGLCDGPQIADYFENPQSSYDKSSQSASTGWICTDGTGGSTGTGRDLGCDGGATSGTSKPTPYPTQTASPTPRPTNNPVNPTPRPTDAPNTPIPTRAPVTPIVVTAKPTQPTPAPVTPYPTIKLTPFPTKMPTTTAAPTAAPVTTDDTSCSVQDCVFTTVINWESRTYAYQGLATAAWNKEKALLELSSNDGWSGRYSWGGQYEWDEENNGWLLKIYDNIYLTWTDLECAKREYLTTYMQTGTFISEMENGIETAMGAAAGEVTGITVSVDCTGSSSGAFGEIQEDGEISIPFSTWDLNSYDFSDWFVFLFILFSGCFACFCCGWRMHRRRVFKAMEDATIQEFPGHLQTNQYNPETNVGTPVMADDTAYPQQAVMAAQDDNEDYNGPEIEIGVSVRSGNTSYIDGDD